MLDDVFHIGWIAAIDQVLEAGGWVAYVLVVVSALLWFCVALRAMALSRVVVDRFAAEAARVATRGASEVPRLDSLADEAEQRLVGLRGILRTLVAAAPLLGLLGTVGGMIETFSSLGAARSAEATVAGGISTALVTTQLGLTIGILGLVAARALERREEQLRRAIESHRAHVAAAMRAPRDRGVA